MMDFKIIILFGVCACFLFLIFCCCLCKQKCTKKGEYPWQFTNHENSSKPTPKYNNERWDGVWTTSGHSWGDDGFFGGDSGGGDSGGGYCDAGGGDSGGGDCDAGGDCCD